MAEKDRRQSELWELYMAVASYSPDLSDETEVTFLDSVWHISQSQYLSSLYVPRDGGSFEDRLATRILHASKVVCLAGERGAGKTSALLAVRSRIEQEMRSVKFEIIDMRKQFDTVGFGATVTRSSSGQQEGPFVRAFGDLVCDVLTARLFPSTGDIQRLVSWALSGPPDAGSGLPIDGLAGLHHLYADADSLAQWPAGLARQQRQEMLLQALKGNRAEYDRLRALVWPRLRTSHVIHAFLALGHPAWSKVVVVLDNVDRVPSELQTWFLAACRDIQVTCGRAASTVVAIRTENVSGVDAAEGDERFLEIVAPDGVRYPAVLLPSLETNHTSQIFEKREAYATRLVQEHDAGTKSGQPSTRSPVHEYHAAVVREFIEHRVYELSNSSIRTLLSIYTAFMQFLQTAARRTHPGSTRPLLELAELTRDDGRYLETLFFLWLYERGNAMCLPIEQIIENDLKIGERRFAEAAPPRYLLLTCIHNLESERAPLGARSPGVRWSHVVERMEQLGYHYDDILSTLVSYLSPVGEPAGVLQLSRRELAPESIRKDGSERVSLTNMGRSLIQDVITRVGYIWGVARRQTSTGQDGKSYFEFTREERARHVYDFCKSVARDHLWALSLAGGELKKSNRTRPWTQLYRRQFGVARKLQCELILDSATLFYVHLFAEAAKNPFVQMGREFSRLFERLEVQETLEETDYAALSAGDDLWA